MMIDQLTESVELLGSSWVKLQLATFPTRPRVGRHPEQQRRFGLSECAECTSEVDQVQIKVAGVQRTIRHV